MTRDEPRRFTILDAMVLMIGLAIGLAWVIADIRFLEQYRWTKSGGLLLTWVDDRLPLLIAPVTIAVFALRLTPPRPSRRRLCREPGFVACGAVTFILVATAVVSLLFGALRGAELAWNLRFYRTYWMVGVGPSVVAAWLLLIVSRRWRSVRTWVDRLGRGLGWLWIITRFGPLCYYYWDRLGRPLPLPSA